MEREELGQLYRAIEVDRALPTTQRRLDAALAAPRKRLTPQARRVVNAHTKFMVDSERSIKGELTSDGRAELTRGGHRAHYVLERGSEPVPVWVLLSCADPARLDRFVSDCRRAVERSRLNLRVPTRERERTAAERVR